MSRQPINLCPYFEERSVTVPMPDGKHPLTLTVPRCHLAEVMRARLDTTPSGQAITLLLTTTPLGDPTRMMYGPDKNAITAFACRLRRLQARCQPDFVQTLLLFALDATIPETV